MAIEYPSYMQNIHNFWLDGTGDHDAGGVGLAIANASATNPYTGLTGYDPTTDVAAMATAIATFAAAVAALDPAADFVTYNNAATAQIDAVLSPESYILARVAAHAAGLDTEINSKIIPRFNAGMRDINAVQSSAFVIGRAIIELDRNDKVDKFMSDMRFQVDAKRGDLIHQATSEMVRMYLQGFEYKRVIAAITIDELRLKIAAQADYKTEVKALAADLNRWPLEVWKYGGNMLAAIGGGTTSSVPMDGSKTARIIGSGLSGAIAGAQIGAAMGGNAGYGAILGGIAGAFAGS
jgi:hypothetical protein